MGERQYYYFYGSTTTDGGQQSNGSDRRRDGAPLRQNGGQSSPANASSVATENDSLVGECLISTDNDEEETPKNSEADFQQLLVSHGSKNGHLHPLTPLPEEHDHRPKATGYRWNCCSAQYNRLRKKHSVSHIILISAGVTLGVTLFVAILFTLLLRSSSTTSSSGDKSSSLANPTATALQSAKSFQIPWEQVDRNAYNDPVSNFIDTTLFHSSLLCDDRCNNHRHGDSSSNNKNDPSIKQYFIFPFPTGAFWTNLVLPPTADRGLSYPVAVYPYAYKWSDKLLQTSYPALHRKEEPKAIHDYFFPDLTFGVAEDIAARKIMSFDPLSVSLRYFTDSRDSYMETYLVQGSPYITIKYSKTSPILTAFSTFTNVICPREDLDPTLNNGKRRRKNRHLKFGVCSSKNDAAQKDNGSQSTTLTGVQFTIETQEGVRWIVFASELATLEIDMKTRTEIRVSAENGTTAYSGILRFVIIPPESSSSEKQQPKGDDSTVVQAESAIDQILESTGVRRLIYHAGVYPVSGAVNWSFRSITADTSDSSNKSPMKNGRIATLEFKFEAKAFTPTTNGPKNLLMLALPHHSQALPQSTQLGADQFDLVFQCIKGPMKPIIGSTWSYDVPLQSPGIDGVDDLAASNSLLSPGVSSQILTSLEEDVKIALPTSTENVYGFGKQVARLAQLAHIARRLVLNIPGNSSGTTASDVLQDAARQLKSSLKEFLQSKVSDSLVYDANLGGMVTKDGLLNSNADFGNGRYNDHHFHYGYILYACAILGSLDPSFVKAFANSCDSVFYDIAHNSNFEAKSATGPFFPGARHKVWFDGHSFASGMFPFGNGKSQESSSEAVNGYFGAYLWSVVRNGAIDDPTNDESPQTDFARLLLATEIQGARTYWQMTPTKSSTDTGTDVVSPYTAQFSKNYMVGNLGMLDALCSTWFGNEELYVHMINFLPVTAITGDLFQPEYVAQEYRKKLKPLGQVEMAWRGYVVADQAIDDPGSAWAAAEDLFSPMLDSGLSKSQVLYWIAMRPDFNASSESESQREPDRKSDGDDDRDTTGTCADHRACAQMNLLGDCCPTTHGVFLDCCSR